jgi:hypothetical protein
MLLCLVKGLDMVSAASVLASGNGVLAGVADKREGPLGVEGKLL